jgi:peptide deformylase
MAILNLTLYPDDPLLRVAEPYIEFGPDLPILARDMLETLHVHEGVGLAGPQVGLAKRILVYQEPDGDAMCLVNPELSELEGREAGEEGCLSLPKVYAMVPRATRLRVRAFDPFGKRLDFEARDFLARVIQHETDHLNGVIFLDRLDILTRQAKLQEWEECRAKLLAAAYRS